MARYKSSTKKRQLIKKKRQRRWAPFWIVPKALRIGRKVHPGRFTKVKRNWRKTKIKA